MWLAAVRGVKNDKALLITDRQKKKKNQTLILPCTNARPHKIQPLIRVGSKQGGCCYWQIQSDFTVQIFTIKANLFSALLRL